MARVLIQFAHPVLSKSRVHAALIRHCSSLNNVTVNDLYERYPDLYIDVDREQRLLLNHDIIVLQHPFYWYSSPAIIKQWFDLVLEHNWAYGSQGRALVGKKMMNVISCGGSREAYSATGFNRYTINQLLYPFDQTAVRCNMSYLPPFVIHQTHRITDEQLLAYSEEFRLMISALADERITPEAYGQVQYMNDLLADLSRQPI
ncbi:glutathione-regulated potassium-efflux system ancillary protein KefG [Spirosoma lacussanchae]|uniref:NAD(P)H-dependent oxidoreductase n=1 Tax=Spirosoma lacussanchae TaxID=1884249 RepID=UPI001108FF2B|nr:NAD(P)H-dependent oxidoreductase [Spirosoma lacussanchae]